MRNRVFGAVLAAAFVLACFGGAAGEGDVFMGDWEGTRTSPNGGTVPQVAQVIALGDGAYRATLLPEFDTRVAPLAVLEGTLSGRRVVFTGRSGSLEVVATNDGETFSGDISGGRSGRFTMKKVTRLSPTLGAKPPEGAVVLFDGTSTEAWEHPVMTPWAADLKRALGGENRVAYLRTFLWSAKARDARMDLGSDDGVKVWLNDALVHAKNVARGVKPDEDQVPVNLEQGVNVLMLKVVQGGGDWGACVRFRTAGGHKLRGLRAAATASEVDALEVDPAVGFLLAWQVAGPYFEEGVAGSDLFDVAFAPEKGRGTNVPWQALDMGPADTTCRWLLVGGGAMQVNQGSIFSKRTFTDHRIHLEFRTPFMPKARGQGRGNSGVYVQERFEVQVLDSYALEGRDNECGGIYKIAAPRVNMCAPPVQWQTYDITFRAARADASGAVTEGARITVVHNGVTIHDDLELRRVTGGDPAADITKPGRILLQDHGNPVEYRNIWVEEL